MDRGRIVGDVYFYQYWIVYELAHFLTTSIYLVLVAEAGDHISFAQTLET